MKNILICLFGGLLFCSTILAQSWCNQPISNWHMQVTTNQTLNIVSGSAYWICKDLTIEVGSSMGASLYLEKNVILNISNSEGDAVFAKDGCTINNNSDADIVVTANPSTVTLNNTGSGTLTIAYSCTDLVYDYSMVGGGSPCDGDIQLIIDDPIPTALIYPNPVAEGMSFNIDDYDLSLGESIMIHAYDLSGRLIKTEQIKTNEFSTEGFSPGSYIIYINTNDAIKKFRLVVY